MAVPFEGEVTAEEQLLGELRAAQEARAEAERTVERLRRSNDALRTQLATYAKRASHDLKTPLTSVRGFLELLQATTAGALTPQSQDLLDRANRAAERLHAMVEALVDNMRFPLRANYVRTDAQRAIKDVLAERHEALERRKVNVAVGAMPAIWADREQFELAMGSLIDNAVDATPEGGSVEVGSTLDGEFRRFTVVDHGPGIEEQYRDDALRIFGLAGPRTAASGLGAGLAHVRRIVEHHGGRVVLSDTPGGGLTVTASFPDADLAPRPVNPYED